MERNLRLYPLYQVSRHLLFWLPVFYLYFASVLPGAQALLLEALYFGGVVVLEVPSGYLSDRCGRRLTLVLSSAASALGCLLFVTTASFPSFAAAQLCLAAGMAFNSGTDSALLYDSLAALGRGGEVAEREAAAQRLSYAALALAAFLGGLLAGVDLRLAYALSGLGSLAGVGLSLSFQEPPLCGPPAAAPLRQLRDCLGQLRRPLLAWTFLYALGMTVLDHVPYELFQPYLELLFARHDAGASYAVTPAVSGGVVAVMMLVASWVSGRAVGLARRLGSLQTLLVSVLIQGCLIGALACWLNPLVASLLVFRNVAAALRRPLLAGLIQPQLGSGLRATYLSLQSLAGRLAFSASLGLASWATLGTTGELTPAGLASLLRVFTVFALVQFLILGLFAPRVAARLLEDPVGSRHVRTP